ncbi:MAG: hypothetical protein IKQ27_06015 [Lachnospiraceae bacterium]|nr:hypothetical protein [Lachnospiraceae bacterium]
MKRELKMMFSKDYIWYRINKFKCRVLIWILWVMGQFDAEAMRQYHICNYKFTHTEWL